MSIRVYIAAALLSMSLSGSAYAQFGHVVVHSDPRLAVLLKKNPTATPPPTPVPNGDAKAGKKLPAPTASATGEKPEPGAEAPHHFVPVSSHRDGKVIYSGKGFRVQIYNGSDRDKAIKVRAEFMRSNPGVQAYLNYIAPCFRVKVGDYRTRDQAAGMLREAHSKYGNPSMIVPDMVTVHAN